MSLRYPFRVALIAAPLFALYGYPYAENGVMATGMQSYLSSYAKVVGTVLSAFDPHVVIRGSHIVGRSFAMSIVKTCDAMEINILLASALLAFPMPLGRRGTVTAISMLLLVLLNVVRLCLLYALGVHAPRWFDRTHQTLAPLFMVACALAIFLVAVAQPGRKSSSKPASVNSTAP